MQKLLDSFQNPIVIGVLTLIWLFSLHVLFEELQREEDRKNGK